MTTKQPTTNERLRDLIEKSGLTQKAALDLFNVGLIKPYSISVWKAYLSDPTAVRFRPLDERLLDHAEKAFSASA
jgi:hypothetical protein